MSELLFAGTVTTGVGHHVELFVPGRGELAKAPTDWPEKLRPGSLNVLVDRYPTELREHGLPNNVASLDSGQFVPEFEILRDEFGNNRLGPRPGVPRGGDAQVWRAKLVVEADDRVIACWALRRFGSGVGERLEFVAGRRLRDDGLIDGERVRAVLNGVWRDA